MMADPVTGDEAHQDGFFDSPGRSVIDILNRGLELEFSLLKEPPEAFMRHAQKTPGF